MIAIALGAAASAALAVACASGGTQPSQSTAPPSQAEVAVVAPAADESTSDIAATTRTSPEAAFVGDGDLRVPTSSIAPGRMRMIVVVDGEDVNLRNGGEVLFSDGLAIELFLDPYPPSTLRAWLDVYLTQDGVPVNDAELRIDYDMLAMEHGPFWADGEEIGGGHYLFTLDYFMYGAWDQLVRLRTGDRSVSVPLVLIAFP